MPAGKVGASSLCFQKYSVICEKGLGCEWVPFLIGIQHQGVFRKMGRILWLYRLIQVDEAECTGASVSEKTYQKATASHTERKPAFWKVLLPLFQQSCAILPHGRPFLISCGGLGKRSL